jgi:hypothetical protein
VAAVVALPQAAPHRDFQVPERCRSRQTALALCLLMGLLGTFAEAAQSELVVLAISHQFGIWVERGRRFAGLRYGCTDGFAQGGPPTATSQRYRQSP